MPVYASFQFFISSDVLLSSFHFTLLYLCLFHFLPLSFHARYFHVLPLSVHILSLSLHAMSKSSQVEYSECMTFVTMVVTIYMCEYWKKQIYTHTKAFSLCSHSFHAFYSPVSFLSVSFHFLPCSFYFRQSYLCFTFTLFNFPPFFLFFHVLLMFLWFPFPFVSFSLSSSFHVPFILLSCHFSFLPFFLQVIPFFLYVLSFFKIISNFRAYSFQIMFMVLGSFHDLPCSFMHRGANSLCDNVQQF